MARHTAALRARYNPITGRFTAPHVDTFRRVLRPVDADAVDTAIGLFLAERAGIGVLDSPTGQADGSPQNGHDDRQCHDHGGQPDRQHRPDKDKPTTRGLSGGRQGRARGDSA
ncbi:MAG: transposase family protein [Actinomycetota bacterium]|nr:transposase family protein [Actinomycetota bacterium]